MKKKDFMDIIRKAKDFTSDSLRNGDGSSKLKIKLNTRPRGHQGIIDDGASSKLSCHFSQKLDDTMVIEANDLSVVATNDLNCSSIVRMRKVRVNGTAGSMLVRNPGDDS